MSPGAQLKRDALGGIDSMSGEPRRASRMRDADLARQAGEGNLVIDRARLEQAVDLQRRSYALLKWLGNAIPRGFISFHTAHAYANSTESARAWVSEHFDNLPNAARPPARDSETVNRFSNVFASYLRSSFDLKENPGTRLKTSCGCDCEFCAVAVSAPHLRAKRLGRADKERAKRLEFDCLNDLAASLGLSLNSEALAALLLDHRTREKAALVTYAGQLLRRCDGAHAGPWVLALWRTFAWHPTGSPIRNFELTPELVLEAERELIDKLSDAAA
jgi:hypothetical protein